MTSRVFGVGAIVAIALSSGAAMADPATGHATLRARVGETASLDVGFARGLRCDDVEIIRPELRGESPTQNRFYVTGVRPGATLCRVGTERPGPSVLVRVLVAP